MKAAVVEFGDDLVIRIPGEMAARLRLSDGTPVELLDRRNYILLQRADELTLAALLAQMQPEAGRRWRT